jgi:protein TonB
MQAIAANPAPSMKQTMTISIVLHAILFGGLGAGNLFSHRGELWGAPGGGAISVGLVGSVPGVPLPRPDVVTPSRVVDETRGLHKAEPAKPPQPAEDAKALPEFERNKAKKIISRPSKVFEDPAPPPENAVPYGQGGAPQVPYTQFAVGSGGAQGALNFGGPGGEFGGRFPWYVEAVRRRVSSNWLQSSVDPTVRYAPRAVISFQILRDGTAANIQILRSSSNNSVDTSAVRAIRDSSPFEKLPNDYPGSYVMVEFWFDFKRP